MECRSVHPIMRAESSTPFNFLPNTFPGACLQLTS